MTDHDPYCQWPLLPCQCADFAAVRADERERVAEELTEAIKLTVEYVGTRTLHPGEGWSWFDALMKYAPDKARILLGSEYRGPDYEADLRAKVEAIAIEHHYGGKHMWCVRRDAVLALFDGSSDGRAL